MAAGAIASHDNDDMGTAGLAGRRALEISVVRSLSERSNLRGILRFVLHLAVMGGTGTLIWLAQPNWWLMLPAMLLHGCTIVTMFAPMHESVHRTAFASHRLNDIFGWVAATIACYNFHYYRLYHTHHHRYTQDPARDPELSTPPPASMWQYAVRISGIPFWANRPFELLGMALGRTKHLPWIPEKSRMTVACSAAAQLALYGMLFGYSLATGSLVVLHYWLLPAVLAQPLLRLITIVEHTGCTNDENGLTNTRTTLTMWPLRFLMWNMPFHAEHHLYPSIPFHHLPDAHRELREKLQHIAPGYVAANIEVAHSLAPPPPEPTAWNLPKDQA